MFAVYNSLSPKSYTTYDEYLGKVFNDFWSEGFKKSSAEYSTKQTEDGLELTVDLPGVKVSDLKVESVGNKVSISGKQKGKDFHHTYTLSKAYNPETAKASLEDGVLTLSFAKHEIEKPKTIAIEVK